MSEVQTRPDIALQPGLPGAGGALVPPAPPPMPPDIRAQAEAMALSLPQMIKQVVGVRSTLIGTGVAVDKLNDGQLYAVIGGGIAGTIAIAIAIQFGYVAAVVFGGLWITIGAAAGKLWWLGRRERSRTEQRDPP